MRPCPARALAAVAVTLLALAGCSTESTPEDEGGADTGDLV